MKKPMIVQLPIGNILHKETVLEDDFNSEWEGWEIVADEKEKSFIKDSCYWMENKSNTRWMFYHKKMPIKKNENFIIHAQIELLSHKGYGQYGLVWGFDYPNDVLNRFTVSADSNRCSVCKFEKNHERVFHRFSTPFEKKTLAKHQQTFTIMLLEKYYYFFIEDQQLPVYSCHQAHLPMEGYRFGFYLEPGILMRCNKITVKRLITSPDFTDTRWELN
jgi:hypothetical protein